MMHPQIASQGREWRMPNAREQAEAAMLLADREFSAALPEVRATVASLADADAGSRSIGHRALGHALLYGGRADDALAELRTAVRLAQQSGEAGLVTPARTKLAFALHLTGRLAAALRQADRAAAEAPDEAERARVLGTRALIHRERGHAERALADLDEAVATLHRSGDDLGLRRSLVNRAILRVDIGACAAAEADLTEAEQLATRQGHPAAVTLIASNLGYARARAGDVPRALDDYARAEAGFRANGLQLSGLLMDRAELLHATGLNDEAMDAAEAALAAAHEEGRTLRVLEARLLLARTTSAAGDHGLAREQAGLARDGFRRQGRATWAAAAAVQSALITRDLGGRPQWRPLVEQATVLEAAGWRSEAIEAWLLVASGAPEPHRKDALVAAARHRSRGPALIRARGWYAQALLAADDPSAVRRAARRGLAVLDAHVAGVGADELRAGLARHRLDLAALEVDLALARGSAPDVFGAVERARATVLVRDTVRPPADAELAGLLGRYRAASGDRKRAALARQIRDRSHARRGAERLLRPVRMGELDAHLTDAAMVVWFARNQRIHGLTRVNGRTRLHDLGPEAALRTAVDRLRFAAHRLAVSAASDGEGMHRLLSGAAAEVSASLIEPLTGLRGRNLVLVPPAFLHAVPWAELPGLAGRPLSVAASVRQWQYATATRSDAGRVLVAAGPGLPGARREAETIAGIHRVRPLLDPGAGVQAVLDGLAHADLAHLATHGWLRPDNPQFSELTLSDGPLLVHHLDTIDSLPSTLVLASCDSGRPVTRPGEALLGFAAACLTRGTRTLIAPVAPVPDGSTAEVMTRLHSALAAGVAPAAALASAQADQPAGRRSFVCLGAGSL